jgi:hypothetical protein
VSRMGVLGSAMIALGHPDWWAISLAAFLVRGGFLVILLPIASPPSVAALTNLLSPSVEQVLIGSPSLEWVVTGTLAVSAVLGLALAGLLVGAWLDLSLVRLTAKDRDIELGWAPVAASPLAALGIRLVAHVPTALALGYAAVRFVDATYAEMVSPADPTIPLPLRVLGHAPDAAVLLLAAWLLGETVGPLAARRHAAGEALGSAIRTSLRQLGDPRGLATLLVTNLVLVAIAVPFTFASDRAWERLRVELLEGSDLGPLAAELFLLITTWVLGVALLAAALAWRATCWTLLAALRGVTHSLPRASEPSR